MSNENTIQRLKEQLQMICNKIENVLLEFKEIKEKNRKRNILYGNIENMFSFHNVMYYVFFTKILS